MINKIEELKKDRASIIKSYSNKPLTNTYLEELVQNDPEFIHGKIKDIIEETLDVKSFVIESTEPSKTFASFYAGQYTNVFVTIDDVPTTRAYSLSSSPKEASKGIYRITVKRVKEGLVSNYLLDNLKIGDSVTLSKPRGEFYYNEIRDEENVIAIAGGSGITPFMSMAKAIEEGSLNCNLTIFYSVKTEEDIIFKKEIEAINHKSKKVKFIITLTRDKKEGYLNGHISKKMLEPYFKEFNTVFMCGPKAIYESMNEILGDFNIPKKSVHYENFQLDYSPSEVNTYELKVILKNDFIITKCQSDETLLVALEKASIKAPSFCRVGVCGYCRSILLEGKIKMIGGGLKKAEMDNDYIHPCITYPESDIVLRLDI